MERAMRDGSKAIKVVKWLAYSVAFYFFFVGLIGTIMSVIIAFK